MSAEVSCLSLAAVPSGEQRSRFLGVGLADQTVRIVSLDPTVSVCVCVCVCVYMCVCVRVCICMCVFVFVYTHMCTHAWMVRRLCSVCIYVCIHMCGWM